MTQGFSVNISGEDINKMIAQAVLDSVLGEKVREAVTTVVNKSTERAYNGDSQIIEIVRDIVRHQTRKIVEEEFGGVIRERIKASIALALEDERDLVGKVVWALIEGKFKDY